ncbi:MAG: LysR family transcriptional regulator [Bacilli bacterium]|jgi:DNA-binding transcriptional LysR family regulator|nr:LysR family transcriptional regulator [Bacilli bacterium]
MYNSNLNLNLYKMFYDVAQYGSVSTASKNLNISQPAISRAIKRLEEDLDVTLFYRTLNGMILTEKGRELLTFVEEACNSLIIGERTMMETNSLIKGKLTIGVPQSIASFYLLDRLNKFHETYKDIEISLINRPTEELIKLLESHELDIIIDLSPIQTHEKELHIEELIHCHYGFVVKSDLDINVNKLSDLEDCLVVLPIEKSFKRQRLNEILMECGVNLKNTITIESNEMIKETIKNSNSIGYVLLNSVEKELKSGELKEIEFEKKLPYATINLVYIDKYLTKAPQVFIEDYLKKSEY